MRAGDHKAKPSKKERMTTQEAIGNALSKAATIGPNRTLEDELRHNFPASFFIPNVGQEKAIAPLKTFKGGTIKGAFMGGNGVGKTAMLCDFLTGLACGKNQIHKFFEDWAVFEWADMIRQKQRRHLKIRLICHQGAMEENGGLYLSLQDWMPKGWCTWSKNQKSYYNQCDVRNPVSGELLATIQVRTFDQDRVAHAGDNLDVILSDEPFPGKLYSENVGRLRRGGILWIFCTPLEVGGWIKDQLYGNSDIHFTTAPIWDNCKDWHPDPIMWSGGQVGVGVVLTRGHLLKEDIDSAIRDWEREGIEVRKARELGEFTHLAGQVLKEWNESAHVMEPFEIPKHWPIYRIMDPSNGGKPDFVSWWAQGPDDQFYGIACHPEEKWTDACKKPGPGVQRSCEMLRIVEEPFRAQVEHSFADPALWKFQSRGGTGDSSALAHEFAKEGFEFAKAENDPKIGMSKLREMLYYDPAKAIEPGNLPKMRVFRYNYWTGNPLTNLIKAPEQWVFKPSAVGKGNEQSFTTSVTEDWKDPVDTMRYLATRVSPFREVTRKKRIVKERPVINRSARW